MKWLWSENRQINLLKKSGISFSAPFPKIPWNKIQRNLFSTVFLSPVNLISVEMETFCEGLRGFSEDISEQTLSWRRNTADKSLIPLRWSSTQRLVMKRYPRLWTCHTESIHLPKTDRIWHNSKPTKTRPPTKTRQGEHKSEKQQRGLEKMRESLAMEQTKRPEKPLLEK